MRRLVSQRESSGVCTPPRPPECPAGWELGPPDFIGVGSQRCGTTRWFDLIVAHPEVIAPTVTKELHYFDRFYAGGFTKDDGREYHRYFPRDRQRKVGEWTPLYMAAPWIPPLLAAAAPHARLLAVLRDPVERYLSGLQHASRLAMRRGEAFSEFAPLETFMRGFYHAQLVGLMDHFDRSQILVLQFERCAREPLPDLRRTYEFLGLQDAEFVPNLDAHPHRQPSKPTLDPKVRDTFVRAYRDDVRQLVESFPEIDLGLWPNFAHIAG